MRLNLMRYLFILTALLGVVNSALANPRQCKIDLEINDHAVFVGVWLLESTRPSMINGSKETDEIWQFGADGTFKLTATDPRASGVITSASTYTVENNTLKIALIGRGG